MSTNKSTISKNQPVSIANTENFKWGEVCNGWHLLKGDAMSVVEEIMPPKSEGVIHYHNASQHFIYVLRGDMSLVLGDDKHLLKKGQGITVTPTVQHHIRNESDDEVNFLVFSSPECFSDKCTKGEDY